MTTDSLQDAVTCWVIEHLGADFKFRDYQLSAICSIIQSSLKGIKTQVGEMPCGSGKSIIALIVCGVLWEYFGKKSYILVSDISLFEQYEADLKKYNLNWGHLKGRDNYLCSKNGHTINNADCVINMVPRRILYDSRKAMIKGYPCAYTCKYFNARKKAQEAPVTVMTYSLWLTFMNRSQSYYDNQEEEFKGRDFIICDEAHKLPDIVQNQFAPTIDSGDLAYLIPLKQYGDANGYELPTIDSICKTVDVMHNCEKPEDIMYCINRFNAQLEAYFELADDIYQKAYGKADKGSLLKYLKAGALVTEQFKKLSEYIGLIKAYGTGALIKTSTQKDGSTKVLLNCAYEDKLVAEHFHKKAPAELLMSATIGNCDIYRNMIGEKDLPDEQFKAFQIPTTFNFSKSPIYYDKRYRLSYSEKAKNMPLIAREVIEICQKHENEKGLIQVSSYELSNIIYQLMPSELKKRIIFYNNSKEKLEAIEKFERSKNKILIGASLWEGLNFPYDKARFLIIAKIPYANLGDKLVNAKMNLIPGWYQNDVCNKLTQGIGRIVRAPDDWGITYILDACFLDLLRNNRDDLPKEILSRISCI